MLVAWVSDFKSETRPVPHLLEKLMVKEGDTLYVTETATNN